MNIHFKTGVMMTNPAFRNMFDAMVVYASLVFFRNENTLAPIVK